MYAINLKCLECNTKYDLNKQISNCFKCGHPVTIDYDYSKIRKMSKRSLLTKNLNMWRYAVLLPVNLSKIVSLGEGLSPLFRGNVLEHDIGARNLYFKLDFISPTGSFKDRGASVLISKSRELGINTIAIDSSGNAAASISAYAARAKISCYVFTPAYASMGKIAQALINGAKVIKVNGTRNDAYEITKTACEKFNWYYCGFQVNPYALEGAKTIAYEICEHFNWNPPDWIVFPVGTGSGLLGCWKGLKEMYEINLISKIPRLICIQPEGCSPIVRSYKGKLSEITPVKKPETIAEGLMIGEPLKGKMVLKALKETEGLAETVSDNQIVDAGSFLAKREGFFVEPSSAASFAGIKKMFDEKLIDKNEKIVCILTGSGLKTFNAYLKTEKEPAIIKSSDELGKVINGE